MMTIQVPCKYGSRGGKKSILWSFPFNLSSQLFDPVNDSLFQTCSSFRVTETYNASFFLFPTCQDVIIGVLLTVLFSFQELYILEFQNILSQNFFLLILYSLLYYISPMQFTCWQITNIHPLDICFESQTHLNYLLNSPILLPQSPQCQYIQSRPNNLPLT